MGGLAGQHALISDTNISCFVPCVCCECFVLLRNLKIRNHLNLTNSSQINGKPIRQSQSQRPAVETLLQKGWTEVTSFT